MNTNISKSYSALNDDVIGMIFFFRLKCKLIRRKPPDICAIINVKEKSSFNFDLYEYYIFLKNYRLLL